LLHLFIHRSHSVEDFGEVGLSRPSKRTDRLTVTKLPREDHEFA
jgi:hypothetical protein